MKRTILSAVPVLSLLTSVAMLGMWSRSYRWMDGFRYDFDFSTHCCFTRRGAVKYLLVEGPHQVSPQRWSRLHEAQPSLYNIMTDRPRWEVLGLSYGNEGTFWWISFPFWLLALIGLLPAAFWLRHRRHQRRANEQKICPTCGYDLRASPERCPECGSPAVPSA
jgi:hypothetical protein